MLVNGVQGREISCRRVLRKGDPLSPLIFVLVANGFHYMISNYQRTRVSLKGWVT